MKDNYSEGDKGDDVVDGDIIAIDRLIKDREVFRKIYGGIA